MKNIGRILALFLLVTIFYVVQPASASTNGASDVKLSTQIESALDLEILQNSDAMKSLQTQSKSPSDDADKKLFDQKSNSQSLQQAPIQQDVTSGSSLGISKLQGTVPDFWEVEPNNTTATADSISLDGIVRGTYSSSNDLDCYKIVIPQAGTLNIIGMAGDGSGTYSPYFTLGLYDTSGNSLDWTNDETIQGIKTQYMEFPVPSGTYYLIGRTWDPIARTYTSIIVGQTYSFTVYMTNTDTTPPTVVSNDYYHATNVPVSANFGISYDETIKIVDPSKIYFYEWDTYKKLMATTTVDGTKLWIKPVNNFLPQTKYMINVDKGAISDNNGNIPENYYYSFTTGYSTLTLSDGSVYVGDISNNKPNGQGTRTWPDGMIYVGKFVDGFCSGQGTMTYPNGDKYVGEFQNDLRNGQGTYTWANGDVYVGQYKNGQKDGQGTFTYTNGDKYVGEFKDNSRNGQGTYTWANGDKYVGQFQNGKFNGQGTKTFVDGRIQTGLWQDNVFLGVNVTSVSLNKRSLTLTVGMTEKLLATIAPANATNQAVAWVSNKNSVATVDATGVVKAVGAGQARISIVTAEGGKTDYCDVDVQNVEITLQSITITNMASKLSYQVGDALDITGLVVTGTYCDSSTKLEPITAANVTGFNSAVAAANQVLTITVGGKTVTYEVQIVAAPLKGDNNGDGTVNILDVVQAVNFALGKTTPTSAQLNAADMNSDGGINILDVVQIVNKALGK